MSDGRRDTVPSAPSVLSLERRSSPCEVCTIEIGYEVARAAPGCPEFVNVLWPETALLGWLDGGPEHPDHVRLLLLCSRVCLVSYRDARACPDKDVS